MIDDNFLRVDRWMPSTFTFYIAAVSAFVALCVFSKKRLAFIEHCNQIPGPPAPLPLVGNALELLRHPDGTSFNKMWTFRINVYQWEKKVLSFPLDRLQSGQVRWDKKKEKKRKTTRFTICQVSFILHSHFFVQI